MALLIVQSGMKVVASKVSFFNGCIHITRAVESNTYCSRWLIRSLPTSCLCDDASSQFLVVHPAKLISVSLESAGGGPSPWPYSRLNRGVFKPSCTSDCSPPLMEVSGPFRRDNANHEGGHRYGNICDCLISDWQKPQRLFKRGPSKGTQSHSYSTWGATKQTSLEDPFKQTVSSVIGHCRGKTSATTEYEALTQNTSENLGQPLRFVSLWQVKEFVPKSTKNIL